MNQFIVEEYKSLVAEMQRLSVEARQLELYCGGAVAAIYSWFFVNDVMNEFAWFFPLLIPVLGLIRSWAFYQRIRQIAEYVRNIESVLLNDEVKLAGWETHYARIRQYGLTPSGILYWWVLLFTCFAFPFLLITGLR